MNSRTKQNVGSLCRATMVAAVAVLSWCGSHDIASAQSALSFNNVLVYQAGSGTNALNNTTGNDVILKEFTPAGTLVQSIALPASGAGTKLINAGLSTSEGSLSISTDGRWVGFSGYNATIGQSAGSLASSAASTIPRVAGILNTTTGTYSLTVMGTWFSAANPRGVATNDGNKFLAIGGVGGVVYGTVDGSSGSLINTAPTLTGSNLRTLGIANNNLYVSAATGAWPTVGLLAGTPLVSGTSTGNTLLPNIPAQGGTPVTSRYGFVFLDANPLVSGVDTLYCADDSATSGGIWKYSLNSNGTWLSRGTIQGFNVGLRGLAGLVSGTSVRLFTTSSGTMFTYWDADAVGSTLSGTATQLTTIATAAANTAFRGVVVVPEPGTMVMLVAGGIGAGAMAVTRRSRRRRASR